MPVNTAAAMGNTAQPSPAAAGIAFPPLLIVPGSPGYAAMTLMLVPVAVWAVFMWMSKRGGTNAG
ncbi:MULTISPECIES: hypothetical protein [unclassified Streptomyces]|uniref:hypothetical protein n=1 Tax=unclassified Streptomyces TaxID=2593676 RepID=UPI0037F452D0